MDHYTDARNDDVEIDVGSLFAVLWREKGWILFWTFVGLALAVLFLFMVDPVYKADARLLIERRETVFTRPSDEQNFPTGNDFDQLTVASQVQVLQSRQILSAVAEKLRLETKPEFDPLARSGGGLSNPFSSFIDLFGLGSSQADNTRKGRVLATLAEKLSVYSVGDSRVVSVELVSQEPALAADIANAIADEFLTIERKDSRGSAEDASRFLEGEIGGLRKKVAEAERKVEEFRVSADLIAVDDESTLTKQQLSETLTLLSDVSAQRTEAEAKANQIRRLINSGSALDSSSDVQSSPLIQRLREQQVALRARIVDLQTSLLPNHPQVQAARSQLNDLDEEIGLQALLIARALEGDAEIAKARQQELEQEIARLKTATARANEQEVKLRALQREATAQREVLETYLTRFRESSARQNTELLPVNARIISRANVPIEVHFPKTIPTLAVAGFSGGFLASLFILASTIMSGHGIHRRKDEFYEGELDDQQGIQQRGPLGGEPGDSANLDGGHQERSRGRGAKKTASRMPDEGAPLVAPLSEGSQALPEHLIDPVDDRQPIQKPSFERKFSIPENLIEMVGEEEPGVPIGGNAAASAVGQSTVSNKGRGATVLQSAIPHNAAIGAVIPSELQEVPANISSQQREDMGAVHPIDEMANTSDLYTFNDALDAIRRYQLEHIVVLPAFNDLGCADLALEISRAMANGGQSVVFVDTTSGELDDENELAGISDVIAGQTELDEAIFADPMSPVDLMASGTRDLDPLDWEEGRIQAVLDVLAENYTITVLHAGEGTAVPYLDELVERSDMMLFAVGVPLSRKQVADVLREKMGDVPSHSMFVYFEDDDGVESAA